MVEESHSWQGLTKAVHPLLAACRWAAPVMRWEAGSIPVLKFDKTAFLVKKLIMMVEQHIKD